MRRAFAALTIALLVAGCIEEPVEDEPQVQEVTSFEQQQRDQLQSELDKIQSQINRNMQKSMKTGQDALRSAKPRTGW
jgi:hypothetical protein